MSATRALLVGRPRRFVVAARLGSGEVVEAHLPSTGRLDELLVAGAELSLKKADAAARKTAYDVFAARHDGEWVCVDTRQAATWVRRAWTRMPGVPHLALAPEPRVDGGRLDFAIGQDAGYVEVKSSTLVERGCALFPDAPTERGRRQVATLAALAARGIPAYLVFAVLRGSARAFRVYREHDAAFADAVAFARRAGVKVLVPAFDVDMEDAAFRGLLPDLDA